MGEIPRNEIAVAMVLAVNCPPHAPAPGHATFSSSVTCCAVILPAANAPGGLEHVLNRHIVSLESPGHDRAAIEHKPRKIEPCESHHRGGNRFVAAADRHDRIERVRADEKLDGISDHFARDQRAFIPSVPMVIPSEMTMVLHSIGVPPAARIPSFTFSASVRR